MHCWMVPDDIYVSLVKTKIAGNIKTTSHKKVHILWMNENQRMAADIGLRSSVQGELKEQKWFSWMAEHCLQEPEDKTAAYTHTKSTNWPMKPIYKKQNASPSQTFFTTSRLQILHDGSETKVYMAWSGWNIRLRIFFFFIETEL